MIPKGLTCVMCGKLVRSVPALEPDGGQGIAAALWLCPDHRDVVARQLGDSTGMSPGRPPRSAHDQRVERIRALRPRGRSSSRAPAPSPPTMPASAPPRPAPPRPPRPGPWT